MEEDVEIKGPISPQKRESQNSMHLGFEQLMSSLGNELPAQPGAPDVPTLTNCPQHPTHKDHLTVPPGDPG